MPPPGYGTPPVATGPVAQVGDGDVKMNGNGESSGGVKGKDRPLFCVVCASNNVSTRVPRLLLTNVWNLIITESVNGSTHGPGVS